MKTKDELKDELIEKYQEFIENTIYCGCNKCKLFRQEIVVLENQLKKHQIIDQLNGEKIPEVATVTSTDYHNDIYGPGNDNYGRDKPFWDHEEVSSIRRKVKEPEKSAEEIVRLLAEWSEKYPRDRIYHVSKMSMDDELIAIEKQAKEWIIDVKEYANQFRKP